jgi:hypothetical protein
VRFTSSSAPGSPPSLTEVIPQPAAMAATSKCLARSNKSRAGLSATKRREALPQRGAISDAAQRLDPLRVSAAGLPRFEADMSWRREPGYLKNAKPLDGLLRERPARHDLLPSILFAPAQVLSTGCVTYGAVSAPTIERASAGTIARSKSKRWPQSLPLRSVGGRVQAPRSRSGAIRSSIRSTRPTRMWYCAPAIHRSSRLRSTRSRTCSGQCGVKNSACALSQRKQGFESPRERQ